MKRIVAALGTAALAVPLVITLSAAAQAEDAKVQEGTLKCDVEGGVGLLLGSKKDMTCIFDKKDGTKETYKGHVLTIGIDVGITGESHITWEVFARSEHHDAGALEGSYAGVTGQATVAGGVGANILVGGKDSFSLQPLSVQTQKGLNIAGGIGEMKLTYVPS